MANENKPTFPRLPFFTPIGRMVQGDPTKASDVGHGGKKRDVPQYHVALAIPKNAHGVNELLGAIFNHALNSFAINPNIQNLIRQYPLPGPFVPEPQRRPFAWKIQDGDWPSNVQKEGHAGCWIFHFAGAQKINICDANGGEIPHQLVHLGQYAKISGNCAINGLQDANCGLYLNPQWIKIISDGPVIVTGITAAQAFAGDTEQLPAGMTPFVAGGAPAPQQHAAHAYNPPALPGYGAPTPAPSPYSQAHQPVSGPGYVPQAPQGNAPAYAQGAQGYATAAPAPTTPAPQFQGTAAHSNPQAFAPHAGQQGANPATGQYQQHSGSFQPAAGQPVTHMQHGGGAHGASPSNPNGFPPVQPHPAFVTGQQ